MNATENKEDFKKPSKCAIRVSLKEHKFNIHKSTIAMLNRPQYIHILINKQSKTLFIKRCEKKDRDSIKIPEDLFAHPKADCVLYSKVFTDAICNLVRWEKDSVYRMEGRLLSDLNAVEFNLTSGKKLAAD